MLLVWNGARLLLFLVALLFSMNSAARIILKADAISSKDKTVVRYCVDPNWLPYEAIREGRHTGMSFDYLQLISQFSALEFELVPTQSWSESLSFIEQGKCDMTPMLNKTQQRSTYLLFSDIYLRSPNVLVSLKDQPFLQGFENIGKRTLAIPKNYRLGEYIQHYYPKLHTIVVENEPAGLDAVQNRQADLFVGSMFSVNTYIQSSGFHQLKIAGWGGPEDELRVGVARSQAWLLPVINQALAAIDEPLKVTIHQKWNNINVVDNTNYRLVYQIIFFTLFLTFILGAKTYLVSRYNRKLTQKNQQLEALKKQLEQSNSELEFLSTHDPLTKLYNRHYFKRFFINEHRSAYVDSHCLVMLDIDHFKRINDSFGHSTGDRILEQLSLLLLGCVRETDVVARWGGEEFVILCHQSTLDSVQHLCQRITAQIAQCQFAENVRLTCSFGIAQLLENENMAACFERADKALYKAKALGRNQICTDNTAA